MKNKMRKKYQRRLNKNIRYMNRAIEKDELWLGRFTCFQKKADFRMFEDQSGGELYVVLRVYDKKTGYYKDYYMEYAPYFVTYDWKLSSLMNEFITEDSLTWENGFPKAEDFRNIEVPREVRDSESYNFHLDKKAFFNEKN